MPTENQLARVIMDEAFEIHRALGPGLFESVYEGILQRRLMAQGFHVERQLLVPVTYKGMTFDEGFRADLYIERKVVVELKSLEELAPVHKKQVLTYARLLDCRFGLLINFGAAYLKDGFRRIVNGLEEE